MAVDMKNISMHVFHLFSMHTHMCVYPCRHVVVFPCTHMCAYLCMYFMAFPCTHVCIRVYKYGDHG